MISLMQNLKYDTNRLFCETETHRTDLWLPRGRRSGEEGIGSLGSVDANYYV